MSQLSLFYCVTLCCVSFIISVFYDNCCYAEFRHAVLFVLCPNQASYAECQSVIKLCHMLIVTMLSVFHSESHLCWESFMLSVPNSPLCYGSLYWMYWILFNLDQDKCHLCFVLIKPIYYDECLFPECRIVMLSVFHAEYSDSECLSYWRSWYRVSFMLSAPIKCIILSIIMLSVSMYSFSCCSLLSVTMLCAYQGFYTECNLVECLSCQV